MRIVVDAPLGSAIPTMRSASIVRSRVSPREVLLMEPDGLANLAADGEDRVERGHRLLKDHRDLRAADRAHLGLVQLQQIASVEGDRAADDRVAPSGNSRMIESTLTVLPEPDSPTMPVSLPGATEKLTPSTARTSPRGVKNEVLRSLTSSSGCTWRKA